MKTAQDPRHKARIKTMQDLFAWDFSSKQSDEENETSAQIIKNIHKIDPLIKEAAPTWPIEKINKIDLAILRQAVYELFIDSKNPSKVVVDEAVELAKEYGADSSASFINGALGKLITDHKITT